MKATILIAFCCSVFLVSCGNKEAEERAEKIKQQSLSIPTNISNVSAIGKIEPENGLIAIASQNSGIIIEILKSAGDSVAKGDVILILKATDQTNKEAVILNQIETQKLKADSDFYSINVYQAQLDEKTKDLAISEKLLKSGAETQQNVAQKIKELKEITANLAAAKKVSAASVSDIKVLKSQLQEAKTATAAMTIKAEQAGILVTMDAKVGANLEKYVPFTSLAASGKIVVHGEIDEMFASRVNLGNQVTVTIPGTNTVVAKGKIFFLSPILQDKSIFYELAGEQKDRRVRTFKIQLEKSDGLLINQKVQCDIKVD